MNGFITSLLIAAVSPATTAGVYSGYKTADNSVKYRFGTELTTTLYDSGNIQWDVIFQINVNEDTGIQNLRITHELTANILATDTVTLELSFVPLSQWSHVDDSAYASGKGEDAGRCELTQNSDDPNIWDATLTDIYYKCNGVAADATYTNQLATTKCSDSTNTYNSNSVLSESSSNNQWIVPFKDGEYSDDPWCTRANSDTDVTIYSPYQCSKIKCIMERPLDTGDDTYDWAFNDSEDADLGSGVYDQMIILNGRAQLWISSSTFDVALKAPYVATDKSTYYEYFKRIDIKNYAKALQFSLATLISSAALLF